MMFFLLGKNIYILKNVITMETYFIKNVDGKTIKEKRKNIVVKTTKTFKNLITKKEEISELQTFNPSDEELLNDGWEKFINPTPTEEEILNNVKKNKIDALISYDSSENINIFYIKDIPVWIDKPTRAGLKLRLEAETTLGLVETTLWYNNMQFILTIENATKMLYAIELYASKCYDNTQSHIANIQQLTSVDDITNYDYTIGYPEKLNF